MLDYRLGIISEIYYSDDLGLTWYWDNAQIVEVDTIRSDLNYGLRKTAIIEDTLFGTFSEVGVYRSLDKGITWQSHNNGLNNRRVDALTIIDDELFVGTHYSGVWRNDRKPNSVFGNKGHSNVQGLAIFPNPNPGSFSIELPIINQNTGFVTLHDLQGKALGSQLINIENGRADLSFSEVSKGIYLLQVIVNDQPYVTKLMIY